MEIVEGSRSGTRSAMMQLWKEIFHDSDDYISLLFSSYYTDDNVRCVYDDDRLVSMMFTIPYDFTCSQNGEALHGLYLCGLATRREYRGRGIMRDMIESINRDAYKSGKDFTFLIPADGSLRRYYQLMKYRNLMKRELNVINCNVYHSSNAICENGTQYIVGDIGKIDRAVVSKFYDKERRMSGVNILHTLKDWDVILKEHFLSGGKAYLEKSHDGNVISAALYCIEEEGVIVKRWIGADRFLFEKFLCAVCREANTDRITCYDYIPSAYRIFSSPVVERRVEEYGMMRILSDSENLKFATIDSALLKNRILSDATDSSVAAPGISDAGGVEAETLQFNISMMLD